MPFSPLTVHPTRMTPLPRRLFATSASVLLPLTALVPLPRRLAALFGFALLPLTALILLPLTALVLSPLTAHAQSAQGGSSAPSFSAPVLAPQAPSFGNQGGAQPGFGPQGVPQSQGFGSGRQAPATGQAGAATGQTGAAPAATDTRAPGPRPGTSAEDQAAQRRQAQSGASDSAQLPLLERSEFQDFIAQSTGRVLPLYGYNLFTAAPSTFAPVDNIPVTPDYVIGPGDQIVIRVWGQIDGEYRLAVDRDGSINIPKVGTISVSGTKMQDLQGTVRSAIARNFRNFELSVSLGALRSIQIFVVGQARAPGSSHDLGGREYWTASNHHA